MDLTMEDAQSQCDSPTASITDFPPDQSTAGDMDVDSVVDKNSDEGNLGLEDEGGSKPRARNGTDHQTPDLEDALDFGERSYFYGEQLPDAPNPGLNIESLGIIGLPLSLRDARAIIDTALPIEKRAPDASQGIWEIEGPKITFDNPAWSTFIDTILVGKVCEALGATTNPPPRCELSKLCLYEVGSQILPRQDSSEAFATFTVVLPSQHIGGKVHVSHATSTRLLDSASLFSTAALAWYTGVTYEMFPITSGYRLALTYSLTDTSETGTPRPEAPELARGLEDLRCALQEWHQSTHIRKSKIEACLLKHKYTPEDLQLGECALKAPDAFRVANVRSVAEQLGYMVILANLTCDEAGIGIGEDRPSYDSDDDDNPRRRRYSPSWWESPTKIITLEDLVDLNGNRLLGPKIIRVVDESVDEEDVEPESNEPLDTEISIDYEALIPHDPFNKDDAQVVPDKKEYELTEEGTYTYHMSYYYYRTALVLVHEDDASKVLFSRAGVYFALQKLSQLDPGPPTAGDRELAGLVLKYFNSSDRKTPNIMAGVAVKWNDLALWKTAVEKSDMLISMFDMETFVKAQNLFAFEDIRPMFEMLLSKTKLIGESLEFIYAVTSNASPGSGKLEETQPWAQERSKIAFTSCDPPTSEDVSALVTVISIEGVTYFLNEVFPQLKNPDYSGFYCTLVKSLWKSKTRILEDSPYALSLPLEGSSKENAAFDRLIEKCLDQAILGYSSVASQCYNEHKAVDIIEGCLLTTRMAHCRKLFVVLLKIPGSAREKFEKVYSRLIPPLRELLFSKNINVCSPPFIDFFQILVATYLRDVLESKPGTQPNIRMIGCGCASCKLVNVFLLKPDHTETFRYAVKRRTHVESKLDTIADLVTSEVVRDKIPHGLVVTKLPDFMATFQWEARVVEANAFLKSVGEDDMIAKLMGDRYEDVLKALQGVQWFILTVSDAAAASASAGGGGGAVSSSLGLSSSELDAATASPAREPTTGTKRKRTSA